MEENKKTAPSDEEIIGLVAKIADQLCEMAVLLALIVGNLDK